jgi:DNA-binding beta-propeller fold protein YncE
MRSAITVTSQRKYLMPWQMFASACMVIMLASCSVAELKSSVTAPEKSQSATRPVSPPTSYTRPGDPEVLVVMEPITGGRQEMASGAIGEFARIVVGAGDTVTLLNPVAVGGVKDQMLIVDAGARAIYRYDLTTKAIRNLAQAGGQFFGEPAGIAVESDLSFYVADPDGKQVLYFDANGNLIRRFADAANLARPIDVAVDEQRGQVFIADGSYSHVIIFSKTGQAMSAIGGRGRGPGKFRAITAITKGKDSLFVADRLELPLQEIDIATGAFRFSVGQGQIVWPTAIVVDKRNRIFAGDRSDNTIKVFDDIRLIATIGGTGYAPGRFRLVTGMWISDQNILYVADSLNHRVQAFRIVSDSNGPLPIIVQ